MGLFIFPKFIELCSRTDSLTLTSCMARVARAVQPLNCNRRALIYNVQFKIIFPQSLAGQCAVS